MEFKEYFDSKFTDLNKIIDLKFEAFRLDVINKINITDRKIEDHLLIEKTVYGNKKKFKESFFQYLKIASIVIGIIGADRLMDGLIRIIKVGP